MNLQKQTHQEIFRKTSNRDYDCGVLLARAPARPDVGPQPREPQGRERARASWEKFLLFTGGRGPRSAALLQRNEPGGVGGADARPAVLHWLVSDGEFPQVVTDHFGLEEKGEIRVGGSAPGPAVGRGPLHPSSPRRQKPRRSRFWHHHTRSRHCLRDRHRVRAAPAGFTWSQRGLSGTRGSLCPPRAPDQHRASRERGHASLRGFSVHFQVGFHARYQQKTPFNPTSDTRSHHPAGYSTPRKPHGSVSSETGAGGQGARAERSQRASPALLTLQHAQAPNCHVISLLPSRPEASRGLETPLRAARPQDGRFRVSLRASSAPSRSLDLPLGHGAGVRSHKALKKNLTQTRSGCSAWIGTEVSGCCRGASP